MCLYVYTFQKRDTAFLYPHSLLYTKAWKDVMVRPSTAGANGDAPCVGLPARFCLCWSGQLLQRQQTKPFNVVCLVWPGGSSFLCWDSTMEPRVILAFPHRGSGLQHSGALSRSCLQSLQGEWLAHFGIKFLHSHLRLSAKIVSLFVCYFYSTSMSIASLFLCFPFPLTLFCSLNTLTYWVLLC